MPFLVRGPGIAEGICSHVRASSSDLLPTVAELAGIAKWPAALEGGSLATVLRHRGTGAVARPRPELVVHFPHYDLGSKPASALLLDDYKLVLHYEDARCELFDLARDVEERHDLAAKEPERTAELRPTRELPACHRRRHAEDRRSRRRSRQAARRQAIDLSPAKEQVVGQSRGASEWSCRSERTISSCTVSS